MADAPHPIDPKDDLDVDQPFTRPETDGGIGPTLGEDVSPEHAREEDARSRHKHTGDT